MIAEPATDPVHALPIVVGEYTMSPDTALSIVQSCLMDDARGLPPTVVAALQLLRMFVYRDTDWTMH